MPYEQDGDCPFKGLYWPERWPQEKKVTAKKFHKLDELQRRDLIQYFYKRESAVTKQYPQPSYAFPLNRFCSYFGKFHGNIRNGVLHSDEYKAYAFSLLDESQKRELMLYFYERESARTELNPEPPYTFSLDTFRGYFGRKPADIRNTVLHSDEYKAYAEERRRPPPPPEMPRVDAEPDRPSQEAEASAAGAAIPSIPAPAAAPFSAAAGTKRAAPEPISAGTPGAPPGAGARARTCDIAGEAPSGAPPVPPPQSQGEPLPPVVALTARGN